MGEAQLTFGNRRYSVAEYLSLAAEVGDKLEYFDGVIRSMSGGSRNHAKITLNTGVALQNALGQSCTVFGSELKVFSPQANAYMFPDAMVVCGEEQMQQQRDDVLLNPTVVIEVLSPTTAIYDFVEKFDRYKQIPSLKEYVLVSQDQYRVEVRSHEEDWGVVHLYQGPDAQVMFQSLHLSVPILDFYQQVIFSSEREP